MLNLTQHLGTEDQGCREPENKEKVRHLLTFDTLPAPQEITARAKALATLAVAEQRDPDPRVMIGGAPYLMGPLEAALRRVGLQPVYAFSQRESREQVLPDGSTRKVQVFRHLGFVPAAAPEGAV